MVEDFRRFWTAASRARKLMLVTLALLTFSQFFEYVDDSSYGTLSIFSDWSTTLHFYGGDPYGSGWQLHPQAFVLLFLLLGYFASNACEDPGFGNFGWWASAFVVMLCIWPLSVRTLGGQLGLLCLGMAILAALVQRAESKKAAPPERSPPSSS